MTTIDVKTFFENRRDGEYIWLQVDLEQRIRWLQTHAAQTESAAAPLSLRELARKSGLSETALSTMLSRHGKKTELGILTLIAEPSATKM